MTTKHFRAWAEAISVISDTEARKDMAEKAALVCREHNPRFSKSKFFAACNVPYKEKVN